MISMMKYLLSVNSIIIIEIFLEGMDLIFYAADNKPIWLHKSFHQRNEETFQIP